jgi:hypothetical protein
VEVLDRRPCRFEFRDIAIVSPAWLPKVIFCPWAVSVPRNRKSQSGRFFLSHPNARRAQDCLTAFSIADVE